MMRYEDHSREASGREMNTTSTRMDLLAAIAGLSALKERCKIVIRVANSLISDGGSKWLQRWKRHGWRLSASKPVKHRDLWQTLDALMSVHEVTFERVADCDDADMQSCSLLARAAAMEPCPGAA